MRSSEPIPGDPWPHDMVLSIEDRPFALTELLWIREAHDLHPVGEDLPPGLVDTPLPATVPVPRETRAVWEAGWPRIWGDAAAHAGLDHDPSSFERLNRTATGSPKRAELLSRMVGPTWRNAFGDAAFDDSYRRWDRRGSAAQVRRMPTTLEEQPERRDLEALIPAWRAGLTRVVTLPVRGDFWVRLAPNALLITEATRADSAAYRRALGAFADA